MVGALTKIYNRGYFDESLKNTLSHFERYKEPHCLIIFDIDHCKKFNDKYGHHAGDQVLKVFATLGKETIRSSDTLARYGGEEFAVIVNKAKLKQAIKVAENVRKNIYGHEFIAGKNTLRVSVSLGVTELAQGDTSETIIERADKALYESKEKGRNKTTSSKAPYVYLLANHDMDL